MRKTIPILLSVFIAGCGSDNSSLSKDYLKDSNGDFSNVTISFITPDTLETMEDFNENQSEKYQKIRSILTEITELKTLGFHENIGNKIELLNNLGYNTVPIQQQMKIIKSLNSFYHSLMVQKINDYLNLSKAPKDKFILGERSYNMKNTYVFSFHNQSLERVSKEMQIPFNDNAKYFYGFMNQFEQQLKKQINSESFNYRSDLIKNLEKESLAIDGSFNIDYKNTNGKKYALIDLTNNKNAKCRYITIRRRDQIPSEHTTFTHYNSKCINNVKAAYRVLEHGLQFNLF